MRYLSKLRGLLERGRFTVPGRGDNQKRSGYKVRVEATPPWSRDKPGPGEKLKTRCRCTGGGTCLLAPSFLSDSKEKVGGGWCVDVL